MGKQIGTFVIVAATLLTGVINTVRAETLPFGSAVVDGDLSEWAGASWIDLDQVIWDFDSESHDFLPPDLSGAKFAVRWSSDTNRIYMAVTAVDTDHQFNDSYLNWHGQDSIEVFIDPGNTDQNNYQVNSSTGKYRFAQQFVGGPMDPESEGEWLQLGGGWPITIGENPGDAVAAFAKSVVGNVISYEIALKPFDEFDRGNPAASTLLTLEEGMTVGLDVAFNSRFGTGTGFGVLGRTAELDRHGRAAMFLDFDLVGATSLVGDYNDNGTVDAADYTAWRDAFGTGGPLPNDPLGGTIGSAQYDQWVSNFGSTASTSFSTSSSVPEPSSLVLALAMASMTLLSRSKSTA